jgi:hypothetical protein
MQPLFARAGRYFLCDGCAMETLTRIRAVLADGPDLGVSESGRWDLNPRPQRPERCRPVLLKTDLDELPGQSV